MRPNPSFPPLAEAKRHHFCHVQVAHGTLQLQAIADDGTVLDALRLSSRAKHDSSDSTLADDAERAALPLSFRHSQDGQELRCWLFSYDCAFCKRLIKRVLPSLARELGVNLDVQYFDLGKQRNYDLLLAAEQDFGVHQSDVPAIFIGNRVLDGEDRIMAGLGKEIEGFKKASQRYRQNAIKPFQEVRDVETIRKERFSSLTIGIILFAGLLDGINPCAFTTIIFLISYLSLVGIGRKQMLLSGSAFSAAVFITYMLIGIFFFKLSKSFLTGGLVSLTVNCIMLIVVLALAIFSAVDLYLCMKGKSREVKLQLPAFLKEGIRKRIRNFARNGLLSGGASFVLGVIVTGMELTCTGQVYIPIVSMISDPANRPQAMAYLLIYNLAFILPLLAVFALGLVGVTSKRMGDFYATHVAKVKLAMAVLFLAMAAIIVNNMGIF